MTINRHWIYEGVGGAAGLYRILDRMYSLMFHVVHLTCLENWPGSGHLAWSVMSVFGTWFDVRHSLHDIIQYNQTYIILQGGRQHFLLRIFKICCKILMVKERSGNVFSERSHNLNMLSMTQEMLDLFYIS